MPVPRGGPRRDRGEHRDEQVRRGRGGEHPLALEARVEGLAVEALHRDEGHAALRADVEHRADVRVGDARGDLRLAHEPADDLRVGARDLVQHLERHRALQGLELLRLVDGADGATAEQLADLVPPEPCARCEHVVRLRIELLGGLRGL
jgi:hypothetical protein